MLDFGKAIYLDVQKTGSSFTCRFLRSGFGRELNPNSKHAVLKNKPLDDVFVFSTCRDPVDSYLSLYFSGCEGRGGFRNLVAANNADAASLYNGTRTGFENWLAYVTEADNTKEDRPLFRVKNAGLIGLMTFRFLRLNVFEPFRSVLASTNKAGIISGYDLNKLTSTIVLTESLRSDLSGLLGSNLVSIMTTPDKAADFLRENSDVNTSDKPYWSISRDFSAELKTTIYDREWFIYDKFGYERH